MKRFFLAILFLSFFGFVPTSFAYDVCSPYHYYNNPNPTLPCSYNGYDYDSLAVEAGVNSFFYKGPNYALFDNDWWWSLVTQTFETCDGLMVAWGNYNCAVNLSFNKSGALFFGPGASYSYTLTIITNPSESGAVEVDVVPCTSYPYQNQVTPDTEVELVALPEERYAFAYWEINGLAMADVDGTITVTMSESKNVKAVYFRTFQDTAGNFDVTTGDECVIYVRNETGIIYDACHGDAADCFEQAQAAGYATGSEPRESAIIVFDRSSNIPVGHVGIVTDFSGDQVSMHDSNWVGGVGNHIIGDHTETVGPNGYAIKGYIYYTP